MKGIKSMEKLFLGSFFSYNELDIVDHKDIDCTVFITQLTHRIGSITASEGFDNVIGELFTCNVDNFLGGILF